MEEGQAGRVPRGQGLWKGRWCGVRVVLSGRPRTHGRGKAVRVEGPCQRAWRHPPSPASLLLSPLPACFPPMPPLSPIACLFPPPPLTHTRPHVSVPSLPSPPSSCFWAISLALKSRRHFGNPCSTSSHLYRSLCLHVADFNLHLDPSISASLGLSLPPSPSLAASLHKPVSNTRPPCLSWSCSSPGSRCADCHSDLGAGILGAGSPGAGVGGGGFWKAQGRWWGGPCPRRPARLACRSPGVRDAGSAQTCSTWASRGAPVSLPGPGG